MTNTKSTVSQITTFGNNATLGGLDDGTDKLHSGILKALFAASTGNYVYSLGTNGVTQSTGSTYTRLTVDNDIKFYRNNQSYTITGTDMTVDLSAAADASTDRYDMLVIKSFTDATCDLTNTDATVTHNANSDIVAGLAVYGQGIPAGATIASITDSTTFELSASATVSLTNTTLTFSGLAVRNGTVSGTDSNVAALSANDVPIALVKVAAGTGNNIITRPIQLFTAVEEEKFVHSTGDQGGRLGIGTANPGAMLHLKNSEASEPEILLENTNTDANEPVIRFRKNSGDAASSDDLGIIRFEGDTASTNNNHLYAYMMADAPVVADGTEAGRIIFYVSHAGSTIATFTIQGAASGNASVVVNEGGANNIDFRAEGDTDTHALFVDASKDGVGICTSAVDDNAQLTVGGSISLTETSAPTASSSQGKIWTQSDNTLYFQDGAGTTKTISDSSNSLLQGVHTIWVPATAMYATTSNGCSALQQVEQTALRPEIKTLDFDKDADEHAQFSIAMPKNWNEGVIQFQPFWIATSTNTGNVVWGLTAQSVADSGVTNTGFSAMVTTAAKAHSGTSNDLNVSAKSGNITVLNAAADTITYFMINRDVSADSLTADARLVGIKIFYTINAGNNE